MEPLLDPVELSRLKWRCRRGLLENDLLIERFFARHGGRVTARQADGLRSLMDLPDPDLLDLLLARREPEGPLDRPAVRELLTQMRPRAAVESEPDQRKPT
ncbi:MAG: succinate dehydrogenase assembly factor 2 [Ideonella sp.]|nr:succinate dehydrogenase assembly factor 2 [Ideonella sp.]MCC7457836.1 succinate dehydrogenase assembly factor 2 [Nitrospira sp.]